MSSGYISERTPSFLQLGGGIFWLNATDYNTMSFNGSNISQLRDNAGNNADANQGIAANQPLYVANAYNGVSSARWDGVNDTISITHSSEFTVNDIFTIYFK